MLKFQVAVLTAWRAAVTWVLDKEETDRGRDRGEVTATTALIVILVIAAIAAGAVIAAKIANNANRVPEP